MISGSTILKAIDPGYARLSAAQMQQMLERKINADICRADSSQRAALVPLTGEIDKAYIGAFAWQVDRMAHDPTVAEIIIIANSPGGGISGVDDASEVVSRAAKIKPVRVYVDTICASACYYACCGATEIVASPTSVTGSIGTYLVVADFSRAFEAAGIDIYIVRSGKHKGTGIEGAKITADQLAEIKRNIDSLNRHFVARVMKGRKMSAERISYISDGRIYVGLEAQAAGLVDRIAFVDDFLEERMNALTPERFGTLRGQQAFDQFMALANAGLSEDHDDYATRLRYVPERTHSRLQKQYPLLAAEAAKFDR